MTQKPFNGTLATRFNPSVFSVDTPAALSQMDWTADDDFLAALRESWEYQYAEYLGADEAHALVSQLMTSGDILSHEPADTLIAEIDGRKAGIASLRQLPGLSLITMLEVLVGYRGMGVGRQLVMALATVNEPLLAHASIHRPRVRAFYTSLGFQALEQNTVDHFGHSLSFDVMVRPVDDPQSFL